jgi:hypothetical protein
VHSLRGTLHAATTLIIAPHNKILLDSRGRRRKHTKSEKVFHKKNERPRQRRHVQKNPLLFLRAALALSVSTLINNFHLLFPPRCGGTKEQKAREKIKVGQFLPGTVTLMIYKQPRSPSRFFGEQLPDKGRGVMTVAVQLTPPPRHKFSHIRTRI